MQQQKLLKYGLGLMGIAFTLNGLSKLTGHYSKSPDASDIALAWVFLAAGLLNIGACVHRFKKEW